MLGEITVVPKILYLLIIFSLRQGGHQEVTWTKSHSDYHKAGFSVHSTPTYYIEASKETTLEAEYFICHSNVLRKFPALL